ncbi:MAG: hypothetical protein JNK15_24525 [Planctomycetes bacterium]|nr:hypothetical protein [Planctomycetota bacterium]
MRSLAVTTLALAAIGPLCAQDKAGDKTPLPPLVWDADVRRHVAATMVVRGVVRVDAAAIDAAQQKGGHVAVAVEVQEMVHGPDRRTVPFRVYVPEAGKPRPDTHPTPDELKALDGKDRILFLVTVEGENYPVGDDGMAIVEPVRDVLARLKQREVLHRRLLREPLALDRERKAKVAEFLGKVARDADHQRQAFVDLEGLGAAALAEIVAAMNDRRQLPVRELLLANKAADAFEARRIYAPKRVVDGIAAVLNQVTGESFGSLYNGARDEERDFCVRAWTIYAHYMADQARRDGKADAKR